MLTKISLTLFCLIQMFVQCAACTNITMRQYIKKDRNFTQNTKHYCEKQSITTSKIKQHRSNYIQYIMYKANKNRKIELIGVEIFTSNTSHHDLELILNSKHQTGGFISSFKR